MWRKKVLLGFLLVSTGFLLIQVQQSCSSTRNTIEYRTDTLYTNPSAKGNLLELKFNRGPEHNHPLMALWIEDTSGNYIQTLYVAQSIAKGVFGHGDKSTGKWMPGPVRRPAALPVWAHSRNVKEPDGLYNPTQSTPIPDAYTGATPPANFVLISRTDNPLPELFYILFEINQAWDWNDYWTNGKYPGDEDYQTSCQPALVYRTLLSTKDKAVAKQLELFGHSHYNGSDGSINTDLGSITTAKEITETIVVRIVN
jgi:hypothetical protein